MRKGVSDARRRAEVCDQANNRYLEALAAAGKPQPLSQVIAGLSQRVSWGKQKLRGLNLLGEEDAHLLSTVGRGEFLINGFRNKDLRQRLFATASDDPHEQRRRSGQVSRKLRLLRAHGLIHKLPGTHRYQVSAKGHPVIAAVAAIRNADLAELTKAA